MYFIDPRPILESHLLAAPPEDPTPAWTAGTYAIGDERHVVATHRVYKRTTDGASSISPELDAANWYDDRPTNRWAPFDIYTKLTKAVRTDADLVYEIASRYCNALVLDGIEGSGVVVEVLSGPGGTVLHRSPASGVKPMIEGARGYWDYAYGQRRRLTSLLVTDLPLVASGVIRITVSSTGTQRRAIGLINRGALRQVHGARMGGVVAGASATPITYTYRPKKPDGTYGPTVLRPGSKERRWQVFIERSKADEALRTMDQLSNTPAYVMASLKPGFEGLQGFGLVTRGEVSYEHATATVNVNLEDII